MDYLFNRNKLLSVTDDDFATYVDMGCSSHSSHNCNLSTYIQWFPCQMQYSYRLHPQNYSWTNHTDFLFSRNKSLSATDNWFITHVDMNYSSHLGCSCKLNTCIQWFHHQTQCNCLLHPQSCNWPSHREYLFNRNKPLSGNDDCFTTYVDMDRSSHLSRNCNLSTYTHCFRCRMQCSCLLHPQNHSWLNHTDFLFNRNEPLFVVNDHFTTYVDMDHSSHLGHKCN